MGVFLFLCHKLKRVIHYLFLDNTLPHFDKKLFISKRGSNQTFKNIKKKVGGVTGSHEVRKIFEITKERDVTLIVPTPTFVYILSSTTKNKSTSVVYT